MTNLTNDQLLREYDQLATEMSDFEHQCNVTVSQVAGIYNHKRSRWRAIREEMMRRMAGR